MSEVLEIVVEADAEGQRLDRFLRRHWPHVSRLALRELIEQGRVRVNGRPAAKGQTLHTGDRVQAGAVPPSELAADPDLALRVLYEDSALVAIDKPAGVPSHALRSDERGTIAGALLARYPEMREVGHGPLEAGLLHRLDTDTSGVLLAARNRLSFERLSAAHNAGEFDKYYLALCQGQVSTGSIHAYLRADQRKVRVEPAASPGAKPITTEICAAAPHGAYWLVQVRVQLAGRHQVRAQLAALDHPIAGDSVYGGAPLPGLTRHFLHAAEVELPHPSKPGRLTIQATLPDDLRAVLASLEPA